MKEKLVLLIFQKKFRGPEISIVSLIVCSKVLNLVMKQKILFDCMLIDFQENCSY